MWLLVRLSTMMVVLWRLGLVVFSKREVGCENRWNGVLCIRLAAIFVTYTMLFDPLIDLSEAQST